MSPERSAPLFGLLSSVATVAVQSRLQGQPVRLGPASVSVERIHVQAHEIVAQVIAYGPMNIRAQAEAIITVESVGEDEAILHLRLDSNHRTIGRFVTGMLPTLIPRLEGLLQRRGIEGVEMREDKIIVKYAPFIASVLE